MENFRNYFEILGVDQDASGADIKRAYRQQARKYHPDLNPGDKAAEEQFKLLGEAYEVLSDPERRSQYEEYSSFWQQKGFRQRVSSKFSFKDIDFSDLGDFNSFIDQLLNRRDEPARSPNGRTAPDSRTEPRPASRPGTARNPARSSAASSNRRDAEATLTVPLERAYSGGQERIRLEDGRTIEVDMPPGMVTGQRIRLKGQGMGGGNLYLRIEVQPHPFFKLIDNDIFCRIPVTPSEAAVGSNITVPTLDGPVQMTVPAGVQAGKRLRLAGRGYPVGRDRRGDQIMEVDIVMPAKLSDREQRLYQELRSLEKFNPRADLLKSWQAVPR
ncbi:DnaJ C-terminal domain-containing protein [Leptolyngbya iicbica]|uniref:J domain-containing protein n=2 Tax=Cyanophyceae TaxID=3028117 RepID=A0A4Q7E5V4_9CYAN|nr:J domain-containing protein [Leptolyngbya sp. LK]RZM77340.1 J domain-containing protein [Leptolyngbya sp. LK]